MLTKKEELKILKLTKELLKEEVLFRSIQYSGRETKNLHYLFSNPRYQKFMKYLRANSGIDQMIVDREGERRIYDHDVFWDERKG